MKKIFILICILICSACSRKPKYSGHPAVAVTQIYDITDSLLLTPSTTPVYSLCDFPSDIDKQAIFKSVLITDKVLNPCSTITLEDGHASELHNVTGAPHYRKKQVKWFYDCVHRMIEEFPKEYAGERTLEYSQCYATIADELERIMAIPYSRRALLVYSDLMENNPEFNFYNPATQRLIAAHPDSIAQALRKKRPIPDDLRGVRVYFLFRPKNARQDRLFQSIVKVYESLLEIRGARIIVQADCNNITF